MTDLSAVLDMVTRTDPGLVRPNNEDAVLVDAAAGIALLADGMGGYNAGEVASAMTTALLGAELAAHARHECLHTRSHGRLKGEIVLADEIRRANRAVFEAATHHPQYSGMGTTLVAALFVDDRVVVGHVGDSRLYRLRGDTFQTLTRDHSLLQDQIDSGIITAEQARHSQNRNLVTRALGVDDEVVPEIHVHDARAGDLYLLCSDGLNDMVEDEEIAMSLQLLAANPAVCADQLIQMANDNGGRDNVSVVLVKVRQAFPARRSWWQELAGRWPAAGRDK